MRACFDDVTSESAAFTFKMMQWMKLKFVQYWYLVKNGQFYRQFGQKYDLTIDLVVIMEFYSFRNNTGNVPMKTETVKN